MFDSKLNLQYLGGTTTKKTDNKKRPRLLHRTDFFGGLGWMMKRSVWDEEWVDNWPEAFWDDWVDTKTVVKTVLVFDRKSPVHQHLEK